MQTLVGTTNTLGIFGSDPDHNPNSEHRILGISRSVLGLLGFDKVLLLIALG